MRKSRLRRGFQDWQEDDDPLSGMANLFDLAMVFAVALMVALVVRFEMVDMLMKEDVTIVKNPGQEDMEIIVKKGDEIEKYKAADTAGEGKGRRVGIAYQLEDGRIIYVSEGDGENAATKRPPETEKAAAGP
jgi:hypothetical protein